LEFEDTKVIKMVSKYQSSS